jgi:hypothetical protein
MLIAPYSTEKVYESNNYMKCAKKFYNQLKGDPNNKFFVMKDIDTQQTYTFGVNKQSGGNNENIVSNPSIIVPTINPATVVAPVAAVTPVATNVQPTSTDLSGVILRIEKLESQVKEIKEKEFDNKTPTGLINPPKKQDGSCCIQ